MTLALDGKLLLLFGESATFAGCTFEMIFAWLPYMTKGGQSLFDVALIKPMLFNVQKCIIEGEVHK